MAKTYTFDSSFVVGNPLPTFTQGEVKNEPMLFNCSLEAAMSLGGPITRSFILQTVRDSLNDNFARPAVIDTRVHMLMPGWFPCIPGFHHDDVPRTRSDGQPNYDTPEYRSTHVMALVNGDICPTEFAVGKITLPEIPIGEGLVYKKWHPIVEELIRTSELNNTHDVQRMPVPTNKLIYFDDHAIHQGVRAVNGGWRWFGRITYGSDRKPTNETRRQVQVYLEFPMEGW